MSQSGSGGANCEETLTVVSWFATMPVDSRPLIALQEEEGASGRSELSASQANLHAARSRSRPHLADAPFHSAMNSLETSKMCPGSKSISSFCTPALGIFTQ